MKNNDFIKLTKADKKLFKSLRKYLKCRVEQGIVSFKLKDGKIVEDSAIDNEVINCIYESSFIKENLFDANFPKPYIVLKSQKEPNVFKKVLILEVVKIHKKSKQLSIIVSSGKDSNDKPFKIKIPIENLAYAFIRKLENDIIAGIKPTVKNSFAIVFALPQ